MPSSASSGRPSYTLTVLTIVYAFNMVDRHILTILAEDIKADLGVTDAQMGLLYGTAFAIFYALFGIPLGKLADVWIRKRLIAIGIAVWSTMTALSGFASNFASLAILRVLVGIGESSASPAANSMIVDLFPPKRRALAIAIFSSGANIGIGMGIFLGGLIIDTWLRFFPNPDLAPMGLRGWQVAFIVVGLPGLVLALIVNKLKEPQRGVQDNILVEGEKTPFREAWFAFMSTCPPLTLLALVIAGGKVKDIGLNLVVASLGSLAAYAQSTAFGNPIQWWALCLAGYAGFSWCQCMRLRDPVAFGIIFGTRSGVLLVCGYGVYSVVGYSFTLWTAPYLMRSFETDATTVGLVVGVGAAMGGIIGQVAGGYLADHLFERYRGGRVVVGIASQLLVLLTAFGLLYAQNIWLAFVAAILMFASKATMGGPIIAALLELVLPRLRGSVMALFLLVVTVIGLSLGPFLTGLMSDEFAATGMSPGDSLRQALSITLLGCIPSILLFFAALRVVGADLDGKVDKAVTLGEKIGTGGVVQN